MEIKDILGKIQNKGNKEAVSDSKELVKFDIGVLEKYPEVEIRFNVVLSNFGVKDTQKSGQEIVKSGNLTLFSDSAKLISLQNQLRTFEKDTQLEKYNRILYQSKLLAMYKEKGQNEEFISSMMSSTPVEYEMHINWFPKANFNGGSKSYKIFFEDMLHAEDLEKELENFREKSFNMILEEVVEDLKKNKNTDSNIIK
ncbi:MAG: hypothetical protein KKF44_05940 [Nanoarchaeota archaeon]|nr:hypothetical protein [Nanoarchaeota archaeon]